MEKDRADVQMIKTKESFATRLKHIRETYGISQMQLAKMTRLPPSSISFFESGARKPSLSSLYSISRALNISTDFLLCLTDKKNAVRVDDRLINLIYQLSPTKHDLAFRIINEIKETK